MTGRTGVAIMLAAALALTAGTTLASPVRVEVMREPPEVELNSSPPPAVVAYCGIAPLRYLVRRIGWDTVYVEALVGPGQSPHSFEPTPRQMADLAEADVYFSAGLPFEERLLENISELNPELLVVDTTEHIALRRVEESHEPGHEHAESHGHGHETAECRHSGLPDPHAWLDPLLAGVQARSIFEGLSIVAPELTERYDENLSALLLDLNRLHETIGDILRPFEGERVYVFHPAFGYFTDAYGLVQVPIELGGLEPSARELSQLIERAKQDDVRVVFVQPQFSSSAAEAIAEEIGGVVAPMDPLSEDYAVNLMSMARAVREALTK